MLSEARSCHGDAAVRAQRAWARSRPAIAGRYGATNAAFWKNLGLTQTRYDAQFISLLRSAEEPGTPQRADDNRGELNVPQIASGAATIAIIVEHSAFSWECRSR